MRLFFITDTHLGMHPLESTKWLNRTKDYFDNYFIPLIKERKRDGDILLHLGDYFDNYNTIGVDILDYGVKLAEELSSIMPMYIILGNHDVYGMKTIEQHSMRWIKYLPNVHFIENYENIEFENKKCLFLAWQPDKTVEKKILNDFSGDYVFCHSDLKGAKTNSSNILKDGLMLNDFYNFKKIWSGHIHIRQHIKNFTFLGSPYHTSRSDRGNKKGIYILDLKTEEYEFIENNYSSEYYKVSIDNVSDIEKLKNMNWDKDEIDVSISNKLLIGDKKIKSRLEKIFQKFIPSELIWNDDIKIENKEIDEDYSFSIEKLILENIEIQTQLDDNIKNKMKKVANELLATLTEN